MSQSIELDPKIIERLKKTIVIQENKNLKTKEKTDPQMVKWIMSAIEKEVNSYDPAIH